MAEGRATDSGFDETRETCGIYGWTTMKRKTVLFSFGTRPEAIKLAPVILELRRHRRDFQTVVLVTGQHRHMLDQVLGLFGIKPDFDLNIMRPGQSLSDVTEMTLRGVTPVLARCRPDIVLVEGDTASAFATALAAYHLRVAVGHVEAGLRTNDKYAPFPEEVYRRLITPIADIHFAPTRWAKQNLLREGVPGRSIVVTGNPVVDALLVMTRSRRAVNLPVLERLAPGRKLILVTAHRRESFGRGFRDICRAIAMLARRNPEVEVVYPVHLNPNVRGPVHAALDGLDRVHLTEPVEYLPFVRLLEKCHFVLTDSGGIQEEAPSLGKPVLVMREKTERPEAVKAGTARLVGTDPARIVSETERLLRSAAAHRKMARARNPFGDGHASRRIVSALRRLLHA
jgi:UDP-N-acetylglucosamine 2-epimerase